MTLTFSSFSASRLCGLAVGFCLLNAGPVSAQTAAPAEATPTRVTLPADYAKTFKLYDKVDKPDRKIVRYLYVNTSALPAIKPGEPFPDGTVIVMEDHAVATQAGGDPIKGADGRLQPTARVKLLLLMEKRAGWGGTNSYVASKDNGDWEYALFHPDGKAIPAKLDNCYSCHLPQKALDYTFSGAKLYEAAKK